MSSTHFYPSPNWVPTGRFATALLLAVGLLLAGHVTASAQNLLTNPHFDTDLSGWQPVGTASWDGSLDAQGSLSSGSARGIFDATTETGLQPVVSQCVPITVGGSYLFGGEIFISNGQTAPGGAFFNALLYPTPDCSGPAPPSGFQPSALVTAVGAWTSSFGTIALVAGQSVLLSAYLAPTTGGRLQANFDNVVFAPASSTCLPDATTLCLQDARFKVTATFAVGGGSPTDAHVAPLGDSGYLWFFDPGNVEAIVKVIYGCGLGGHVWVFIAGLTNLNVVIKVTDTHTGATKTYTNPANTPFRPIQDTSAFPCS